MEILNTPSLQEMPLRQASSLEIDYNLGERENRSTRFERITKRFKQSFSLKRIQTRDMDRKVIMNKPSIDYCNNAISTSKYNVLTFLPKNLMEQFSKMANVYFLIIGLMQMIPQISISDGLPVIYIPLAIIIIISGLKDLHEDLKRKRSDIQENFRKVKVLRNGNLIDSTWNTLNVGEVIKIEENDFFPCDVLLITTSENKGICYIETKSLDGETNLKYKQANPTLFEYYDNQDDLIRSNLIIDYEKPNSYLYNFIGSIIINSNKQLSCDNTNFILRGCKLKNTKYIYGMIAYTGHDTKIMLNSTAAKAKKSKLERIMSFQVLIIFGVQWILCLFSGFMYIAVYINDQDILGYLEFDKNTPYIFTFFIKVGNWILIFTNFVPISLLVSLEMVRVIQGYAISFDKQMKQLKTGINPRIQSSNLNEELGQVEYIFSDKTGTLTCNEMEFKKLTINGKIYGINQDLDINNFCKVSNVDFKDKIFYDILMNENDIDHIQSKKFMMFLALCHTIIPEKNNDDIIYNASSPDEFALVNFAKFLGFEFIDKDTSNHIIIKHNDTLIKYKLLHVLEFNSTRKRMSVILKNPQNQIILLCKGADSVIIKRMIKDQPYIEQTLKNLEEFANDGLRTLLLAEKIIPINEYTKWVSKYEKAMNCITNREERISILQDEIETELELIGATAIEDKLQDKVADTISTLKEAGIKIWILTGDKMETAINIGFSCKILDNTYHQYIIDGDDNSIIIEMINQIMNKISDNTRNCLIITGDALIKILNFECSSKLMEIAQKCESVICCRVSPKQKQEVVSLVRGALPKVTTLAIGDGANDVNMIIAAHVGIGIHGVEGQQATRASDFAIGEFKFLQNLLLIHGRECYRRNAYLILYNFYKNIVLVTPQFFFGFFNLFSGEILYDPFLYQLFNIFFAALPIIIYAISDEEYTKDSLMKYPQLYDLGRKNLLFTKRVFWSWFFFGFAEAFIITILCTFLSETNFISNHGFNSSFWFTGLTILQTVIFVTNLKILLFSYKLTFLLYGAIIGSISLYYITLDILSNIEYSYYYKYSDMINLDYNIYWGNILSISATLGIDYAFCKYTELINNDIKIKIAEKELKRTLLENKKNKNKNNQRYESPIPNHFSYRGFAFSEEEQISEYMKKNYKSQQKKKVI